MILSKKNEQTAQYDIRIKSIENWEENYDIAGA